MSSPISPRICVTSAPNTSRSRRFAATLELARSNSIDRKASYHGSRLFIVEFEFEIGQDRSIIETILHPLHRQQRTYLRGMTMGISWRPQRMPYLARMIWKRVKASASASEILAQCGVYPIDHKIIDPEVRNFLLEKSNFTGEE